MVARLGNWARLRRGEIIVATLIFPLSVQSSAYLFWWGWPTLVVAGQSLALCLPWLWRRERPLVAFAVPLAVFAAQIALASLPVWANVILLMSVYNLASRTPRRWSLVAAAALALAMIAACWRFASEPQIAAINAGYLLLFVLSAWLWGYTVGVRRAYVAKLREHVAQLERERDAQARIAAAEERARIAREIHDIVSHSVSAVVVLADGAQLNVRGAPDRTEQALADISLRGRGALTEMQRMLGLLRTEPESPTPPVGAAQLEPLVADAREAGLPVHFQVTGTVPALSAGRQLVLYRVVQEALTNAGKHATPAEVVVAIDYRPDTVEIRVSDDGRHRPCADPPMSGHGLVGMRERVTAYGGTLRAGERDTGGFEVVAALPIDTTEQEAIGS